ncbi:hypothetical protein LIER_40592 [Lithospermum erythrorhizon]|uniref:Retrovirus-related Pol polyprotein from transposon TNT 1-94-like beta-barrel domain-containing protein n=1 Tax=Lithospermum erythrorhizon TaxID=34254 RepID=A0AAV3QYB3_LITER
MGKPFSWIFDTGATVHATSTLDCLVDQFDEVGCPLTLPDGSIIHSTRRENVVLSDSLTLRNVLYLPTLRCNLISISQLLAEHCWDFVSDFLCGYTPTEWTGGAKTSPYP